MQALAEKRTCHADPRVKLVGAAFLLVATGIGARLVQLQHFEHAELIAYARRQHLVVEEIPSRPGEILDRRGRLLATTITAKSLWIDPSRIDHPQSFAQKLSGILKLDVMTLSKIISHQKNKKFVWVKRRLAETEVEAIEKLKLEEGTWGFRKEYVRVYPQGKLAAHVIGYRDIDGKGRGGIEESRDGELRGVNGQRTMIRDARGKIIHILDRAERMPKRGKSIVLSIDSVIQLFAEDQLDRIVEKWKPLGCSAVVVEPKTGEVLAMASRPTVDYSNPKPFDEANWTNLCLSSMYPPGSTFKPFVVAWGLDHDIFGVDETFQCEHGRYRMGRRLLRDHHSYGELSLKDVLVKSSNIGMAKIGERMGNPLLYEAAVAFGFGRPTGCELPGEQFGILRPLSDWTGYSTGSIPMGQEIAVTPIQLVMAHAAIANGGTWLSPKLVLKTLENDKQTKSIGGQTVSRVASRESCDWLVKEAMREVITRGTGRKARLEDYQVFGKTGTSQKPDPQTGKMSHTLHVGSFIGGAPVDDPKVLVLVVVDEPKGGQHHYGGTVAAPFASEILKKTLHYLGVAENQSRK